ncbi:DUF2516 family protein [Demequina sp. NBRC 110057]|uniref:DUF2516 family protein n=1 Tax=Demequina sp. NBRC 110057 TaxID=1570346 RepID=UPI0013565AC3|nr:DUF2516 family protein [Demequina sp. NBRC 110057]
MLDSLQNLILVALSVALFVAAVWGLIDALRYPESSYQAAGKQTRTLWAVLLGASTLVSFLLLGGGVMSLFGIASVVIVLLYFVDVRPKLQQYGGRGRRTPRQQSGGW